MFGRYRAACKIVVSLLLAAGLSTVPTYPVSQAASDACTTGDDVRATTCRLLDGSIEPLRGRLDGPGAATTYRLNVLGPGATVNVMLSSEDDTVNASLVDWRGTVLGQTSPGTRAASKVLIAAVPLPGVYGVRVDGDVPDGGAR